MHYVAVCITVSLFAVSTLTKGILEVHMFWVFLRAKQVVVLKDSAVVNHVMIFQNPFQCVMN